MALSTVSVSSLANEVNATKMEPGPPPEIRVICPENTPHEGGSPPCGGPIKRPSD
ncbi:MAG TPA: hypothetical protein VE130_11495 [Nitrososphaeraceae archaeon]|nr:hypothetical protein [Nitrososphaeraceae archaeon]